jgi:uncharacterized integral membrane protein (TIGR00698 family)
MVAASAQFVSEHYGAPAMLMALLFGMTLHFLNEAPSVCAAGVQFASRPILQFGIVLLGARISLDLIAGLGWPLFALVALAMLATMSAGLLLSKLLGKSAAFGVLTSGATAICGASAALAIASVLPKTECSDEELSFTVLAVTLLSTLAMVFYPIATRALGYPDTTAGVFLGATIHDVAQVIGAGFVISDAAGENATVIKLTRVALLAPIVIFIAIAFRRHPSVKRTSGHQQVLKLPLFLIGFVLMAALNSAGILPPNIQEHAAELSRSALLVAIAAVGVKSSLRTFAALGGAAMALVVAETVFLAVFIASGLSVIVR